MTPAVPARIKGTGETGLQWPCAGARALQTRGYTRITVPCQPAVNR